MPLDFVSMEGREMLEDLRIGSGVPDVKGSAPVALLACVPSAECGCPEELWRIDGVQALIHFEEDGACEAFLFAGDWEAERTFDCKSMPALRAALFAWVAEIFDDTGEAKGDEGV